MVGFRVEDSFTVLESAAAAFPLPGERAGLGLFNCLTRSLTVLALLALEGADFETDDDGDGDGEAAMAATAFDRRLDRVAGDDPPTERGELVLLARGPFFRGDMVGGTE